MKINRKDIEWYIKNIRRDYEGKELTDEQLANHLAGWMETNPECIDINGVSNPGRYSYSTVGYGVFSLLGEKYRMGRVEIFDEKNDSGYAINEGTYCMPFIAANQFENFIESLETEYPIQISIGSVEECAKAVSEELGIPEDMLNDMDTKKAYYNKKYKEINENK